MDKRTPEYYKKLHNNLIKNKEQLQFFLNKGLAKDTMKYFGIGWNEDYKNIVNPLLSTVDGQRVSTGYRYKTKEGDWLTKKGMSVNLWFLSNIPTDHTGRVYVCEGFTDSMLAYQLELKVITSEGGAGTWKKDWCDQLPKGAEFVIIYDNDEAGRKGAQKVANSLYESGFERIKIVDLSGTCVEHKEDLCDFFSKYGKKIQHLNQLVADTEWFEVEAEEFDIVEPNEMKIDFDVILPESIHEGLGVVSDYVKSIEPYTEACPIAIIMQILAFWGVMIGRKRYFTVGTSRHYGNIFVVIVGCSSLGKKGVSLNDVKFLFKNIDSEWCKSCLASGLSTGEGMIHRVRDDKKTIEITPDGVTKEIIKDGDKGIEDKRCLFVETEFGKTLRKANKDNSTLSDVGRQAYDNDDLHTTTKTNAERATGPSIGIVGHITPLELRSLITDVDIYNGWANRFMWPVVEGVRSLPDPEEPPYEMIEDIVKTIKSAKEKIYADVNIKEGVLEDDYKEQAEEKTVEEKEVIFSEKSLKFWVELYESLDKEDQGKVQPLLDRSKPHIRRLAMNIALINGYDQIELKHLKSAQLLWTYNIRSVRHIFVEDVSNLSADARKIYEALKESNEGLTRTEMSRLFSNGRTKIQLDSAVQSLVTSNLVTVEERKRGKSKTQILKLKHNEGEVK